MPRVLYGAPWQMGDDQPEAYLADGFEPLKPNEDGRDPYMYVGGRKLLSGDRLLVARDAEPPLELTVSGTDPYHGYARATISVVNWEGSYRPTLVLSPGTLVKRPKEKSNSEQAARQGGDEDG